MASIISPKRDVESIADGNEPDDFWEALGGKGDVTVWDHESQPPILKPRLFHCKVSPVSGKFRAYQIFNFEQDVSNIFVLILPETRFSYLMFFKLTLNSHELKYLGYGRRRRHDP